MAGLLDYTQDPMTMGLLGAGAALLTPQRYGGGAGAALNAFPQAMVQAEQMRNRQRLTDAQMMEAEALAEQRREVSAARKAQAKKEEDERARQAAFWSMLSGGPQSVIAQTGGLAPTRQNAEAMSAPMRITPEVVAAAAQAGVPIDALKNIAESRNWGRDKVAREVTVRGPDGRPRTQLVTDYGDQVGPGFDQPVRREFLNTGNAFTPVDPFVNDRPLPINMSPSERDAAARGWAGVQSARDRLAFDRESGGRPQIQDTSQGLMVVSPGVGGAPPTFTPAVGPDGKPLKKGGNVPQFVVEGLQTNARALTVIDGGLEMLRTPEGADATGLKGFLPDAMLQRWYPDGVDTRIFISDLESMIVKDRSGATVTMAESPRLRPFIPSIRDSAETAQKKLTRLRQLVDEETKLLGAFYPGAMDTATGVAPQLTGQRPGTAPAPAAQPSLQDAARQELERRRKAAGARSGASESF
jgi:hypothetical protein